MEIRPTYLIFVSADNHNKYYNCFPEGGQFRVEYGRIDATKTTINTLLGRDADYGIYIK